MAKHRIRIVQVFKTIRSIEIEVEADDEQDAVEGLSSGAIDTPDFDDPRWLTGWDLQNEEVEPA
ncbi:hypothetical protein [Aquamicrobium defluvii]|jgi:hypothetical protein|uniref:Uncharacterized protein n=2 Tax=Hyphomicrobiales TaxID=356 RepID=A0A011UGH5_9HYPH|nr:MULTISPECIES: hypothetical protein [Hyphomicrobiales]EXL04968.1 hypothetical protein BG36_09320 [Aquamicrobium defluvii]EZQ14611.1 hypothetical protein CF98_18720 [Halopseudomonas bauzanensis]MBE0560615.1 hypothetical protein [Brucella anthropi]